MINKLLADSWWSDPNFNFNSGPGIRVNNPVLGQNYSSMSGAAFFQKLISASISLVFVIGSVIFFFMLIIGAVQWISSGGDKGALEAARAKLNNAFVGIVILFASYAVVKFIEYFFGVHILTLNWASVMIK